jgi:hypothetical protein
MKRYEDLYLASVVVGTPTLMKGRLNGSVDGVRSTSAAKRTVSGICGRCANTGYAVISLSGRVVSVIDLAILNAQVNFLPLDIPVAVGEVVTVTEVSTTGTAVATVNLQYDEA